MSSAEFTRWIAFAELEPWGSSFDDLRAGSVVSAIYNVNRDPKKTPDAFGPLHFMPWNVRRQAELEKQSAAPVLLQDKVAHSNLLRATIFGIPPSKK
ncbi:hypothetical protein PPN31114_03511 [Pandoraea pneumonica]|uniref:Minor tail T domain-containing protein n=1 Tax=Pandoraea pneumonica TaxID=2508299 RepID=A0A5E4WWI0_9BURK|nr:hypothetical protein [Pandoraea pneumonica]VVE28179.1 hypothetical protein PPN31114_03511 [Pandoraea pneumonica]